MNNQELDEGATQQKDALDLIKDELNAKFDSILRSYKGKFKVLREDAYQKYRRQTEKMNEDFEYAKQNGHFPTSVYFSTSDLYGIMEMSGPSGTIFKFAKDFQFFNFKFPTPYKPSWIRRKLIELLFGCKWIDG